MAARIRKGDTVVVIAGRQGPPRRGAAGACRRNRAVVQGVDVAKRHTKPRGMTQGGIVEVEAAIDLSNLTMATPRPTSRPAWASGSWRTAARSASPRRPAT